MTMPTALVGPMFVSEDGKLALRVELGDGDAPFFTTVWAGPRGEVLLNRAFTRWQPATSPSSEHSIERLGWLQAELGVIGGGPTYVLYVVRQNPSEVGKKWVAALPDTPLEALRLFPEYGSTPYISDDWDWDERWWYPYSTYRALQEEPHGVSG